MKLADYEITREHGPVHGWRWIVRRNGVRVGSASTQAAAKRIAAELDKLRTKA